MRLKAFRYSNLFSLDSGEIRLENRGLTLITGHSEDEGSSNGSGKSSLSSKGICWTLYGQTPGGIKADAVVNRHGKKKSAWGEVEYQGVDGQTYKIRRERPSKLKLWILNADTGEFELVALRKSSDTQVQIDRSLGRDFQTFIQTEFFGQGRLLSYASLTPVNQKAVLEQILPMDKLEQWSERAKETAKTVRQETDKVEKEHIAAQSRMDAATSQKTFTLDQIEQWEEDQRKQREDLQLIIDLEKKFEDKHHARLEEIDAELASSVCFTETQIEEIRRQYLELKRKKDDALFQANQILAAHDQYTRDLRFNLDLLHIDSVCPKCERPFDPEHIKALEEKNKDIEAQRDETQANMEFCNAKRQEWLDYYSKLEAELVKLDWALSEDQQLNRQQQALREEKVKIEAELRESPAAKAREELSRMPDQHPFSETLANAEKEVASWTKEAAKHEKQLAKLKKDISHLLFWQKAFGSEMRLKLFEMACPFLEARTQYHLSRLRNDQIKVQFSTVKVLASGEAKEDFNVRVWSETGGEGFDSLSGGEQQMTSFAIGRALADLSRSQTTGQSYFQILDEPFSMLDPRNSEAIVNYLNEEMKDGTILLVSNEEQLKSLVPQRIHVIKRKGVSHAESAA